MNTNNEQLRSDWLESAKNSGESISSLQGIADYWLSKFAAHDAELVRRVEVLKRNRQEYSEKHVIPYNEALKDVLNLLRHTGEDNQTKS